MLASGAHINPAVTIAQEGRRDDRSLIAEQLRRTSGGRAGNVSVMVRRLGRPARLFGCVGTTTLQKQALAGPAAVRVDVAAVRVVRETTSLVAIIVGSAGSKTMVLAPAANEGYAEPDGLRLAAALHEAPKQSVLVVDTEVARVALEPGLKAACENGRTIVLDPTRPSRVTERLPERIRTGEFTISKTKQ